MDYSIVHVQRIFKQYKQTKNIDVKQQKGTRYKSFMTLVQEKEFLESVKSEHLTTISQIQKSLEEKINKKVNSSMIYQIVTPKIILWL